MPKLFIPFVLVAHAFFSIFAGTQLQPPLIFGLRAKTLGHFCPQTRSRGRTNCFLNSAIVGIVSNPGTVSSDSEKLNQFSREQQTELALAYYRTI